MEKDDLRPLLEVGVDWIVQTPFGWQAGIHDPAVRLATGGRSWWGERDEGIEATARAAAALGIRTLLKPHIWLTPRDGAWTGDIAMQDEDSWRRWFASYREFILHYAELAERVGIAGLCVGTELHGTIRHEKEWRAIIAAIRKVYRGKLTYAANWNREFEEVPFWDALDYVGVQAYFPLTEREHPTVEELIHGWKPWLQALERLHRRTGLPILFTEIGYRSTSDAAIRPWEWPSREMAGRVDPTTQANGYEAFFRAVWDRKWLAGAYFWKWYPVPRGSDAGLDLGFTPQGKPAQQILSSGYRRGAAPPAPAAGE